MLFRNLAAAAALLAPAVVLGQDSADFKNADPIEYIKKKEAQIPTQSSFGLTEECNTKPLDAEQAKQREKIVAEYTNSNRIQAAFPKKTVTTYVHVITKGYTPEQGWIDGLRIGSNILYANWMFPTDLNITFDHVWTDYTINAAWADNEDGWNMRQQLRRGSYQDLNIYIMPNPGAAGYAYLPVNVTEQPNMRVWDGVVVATDYVFDGPVAGRTHGKTLIHELGHWLGLKHTFDGGCSSPNDGVSDTPAHASGSWSCDLALDTCPGMAGTDPVENYMNYNWDDCRRKFTSEQTTWMEIFWRAYREGK